MTTTITPSAAAEICQLHGEIIAAAQLTLDKALRVGELLAAQKAALPHGAFGPWVREHLPFTGRTARNYMRLHRQRDRFKTETVSDLSGAYRLLSGRRTLTTADVVKVFRAASALLADESLPQHVRLLRSCEIVGPHYIRSRRHLDRMLDKVERASTVDDLVRLRDEASEVSAAAAEYRIRADRCAGIIIGELDPQNENRQCW